MKFTTHGRHRRSRRSTLISSYCFSFGWRGGMQVCILSICVIFFLSTIHERHMDQHHMDRLSSDNLDNQSNEWIPKSDIIKYMKAAATRNETKEESSIPRYRPSLTAYPLKNLQNITTPLTPTDVIFFWHIPKASGSSVKLILSRCFQLTRAEMKHTPQSFTIVGKNLINFDTSSIVGIAQAKEAGLVDSGYVDAIVSSHLHEGSALFTEDHHGRLFTMMRHPVDMAISLFFYLGKATWERNYNPELANMTLWSYAQSNNTDLRIDNWMTRYLAKKIHGNLETTHFELAKEILEHKCLVGMMDHFGESMERFQSYFGLKDKNESRLCMEEYSNKKKNSNRHTIYKPGDKEWDLLAEKNQYDVKLFQFAKELWDQQGEMFALVGMNSQNNTAWNYRKSPSKFLPQH